MELTDHLVPENQVLGPLNVVKLTSLLWRQYIIKMPQIAHTKSGRNLHLPSATVKWWWRGYGTFSKSC